MLLTTLALAMATVGQGPPEWYEPFPAHKVIGNVYYVGSKDLATLLITTPEGHILINSGFERTVPLIQKSVESLGFKMTDVKILLASHAHSDHVAGHALLQKLTGAKVLVMRGDDQVVASGGKGQYLYTTSRWEPCKVDRVLEDRDEVKLGGVTLVARLTPGHTRGCTTWTWRVEDGGKKYYVVVIGSPNVNPGFQLVNNKDYPEIAADFAKTFTVLKSLPCDVFLGAHGSYYGMVERYALLKKGQANAFVNPEGYKEYVAQKERAFRKTLAAQQVQAERETAEQGTPPAVSAPQAEINNGVLKAQFYLPDAQKGFYRGTRFDWSGVIGSLEYKGHRYYGPWFTKTDPTVNDFIYQGADIVAGPCSAITGPAEEFSTDDKALGYEEAKPGGTFIKIGVGVLRKPQEGGRYNRFRLYEMVDPGTWKVQTTRHGIAFTHDVADPSSGYGYRYQKTIQLAQGRPDMVMDHKLKNTGKRAIASSVYNHNFLVLDGQPPGPDFVLQMPFEIKTKRAPNSALAELRGDQIVYLKALREKETVFTPLQGFGTTAADYRFTIENKKTGAGLKITGDRPLSNVVLWSIRSVLSLEPFIAMTIEPGQEFTWKHTYTYYLIEK